MAAPPPQPPPPPEELDQDAVLRFLAESGGRVRNPDLLDHFRGFLSPPDPEQRAGARQRFKEMVNAVAIVKQEPGSGAKYVQLRKKYRSGPKATAATAAAKDAPVTAPAEEDIELASEPVSPGGRSISGGGDAAPEAEGQRSAAVAATATESPSQGESEAPSPSSSAGAEAGVGQATPGSPVCREGEAAGAAEEAPPGDSPPGLSAPPLLPPFSAAATPRGGRKNFRERMMGNSPQMKRGGGSGGGGGGFAPRGGRDRDSDSASLASSSAEEESSIGGGGGGSTSGGSVALDPLEHAWMLCAADGRWESLEGLLSCEPSLLGKRDFVTGFSCLHWAAKHGRHELLALLVNFARRHGLPVDIDARTGGGGGYTALHLAAMHGRLEVVKLLVGAYDADVDARDYSGRKAWHYLRPGTAEEVRALVGALREDDGQDGGGGATTNGGGRWRLSKVLPANLITYKLSHLHHGDDGDLATDGAGGQGKGKELSRKSSGGGSGRIKPRLNKIRFRTQIIHTTPSFRGDAEEEEGEGGQEEKSLKSSFKLRPKSNVFG